jgi:tRNA(His) 5'-end guanylyltransferase
MMPVELGDRMKFYETFAENNITEIDAYTGFVIRLDGRNFSKIFNNIKNVEFENIKTPFNNSFKYAMDLTTADLVKEFNAATGYNHSDEISLVFKPLNSETNDEPEKEHLYRGRVIKLLTLISSYASVRFQKHLRNQDSEKFEFVLDRLTFDARHIIFPNNYELVNYFLWRSKKECYHNFVNEICSKYFTKKAILNLSTSQRVELLHKDRKIKIDDYNIFLRHGTFIKRELVDFEKDGQQHYRNEYIRFALPDLKCNESYYDLLQCKNYQQWEFQDIPFELTSVIC